MTVFRFSPKPQISYEKEDAEAVPTVIEEVIQSRVSIWLAEHK